MSMADFGFWNIARDYPNRLAVIGPDGERVTYQELRERADRLVDVLRRRGLDHGDGVAFVLPNCVDFLVIVLAANQTGLYYTPLNHNLVGAEIRYILENSEAKAFIAHETFSGAAVDAIANLDRSVPVRLAIGTIDGFDSYTDAIADASPAHPDRRAAGSLMAYTSGTTGRPKGVRRALSGLEPEAADELVRDYNLMTVFGIQAREGEVHYCVSPLYHNSPGSWVIFALQLGHTVLLGTKFDAETFLEVVERERVTSTHMVPVQFVRLLKLDEETRTKYDVSSLKVVAHAGAPCPPDVKRQMIEWLGPVVYEYYSSSEGIGGTVVTPQEAIERPGTVGRPYRPNIELKILDDAGIELPPGEVGLVYATPQGGKENFEYFKDAGKTAGARSGDYFTAGDFGYLDEDGYLYLASRRTDLILSGGVNIYPAEIESQLIRHPSVADVAVIGIPNSEWGEEVKAVVQLMDGVAADTSTAGELEAFCRANLAGYKIPRSFDFVDQLPRDPNGKMYKNKLRAARTELPAETARTQVNTSRPG